MSAATLNDIDRSMFRRLHLLSAMAVIFLAFYGKVVCPFIDTLDIFQIIGNLTMVFVVQITLRELLYYRFPTSPRNASPPRHGFHISVFSWFCAGIFASLLHAYIYPDFHWSSHLKLLSGYWGLGAGILAQLEYVILENHFRNHKKPGTTINHEQITHRIMEGYAIFTLVPALMMVMVSFRFVYEGYTHPAAAMEVFFLGGCFVAAGLFVSWRYGQALRRDCDNLTTAVDAIAKGSFSINVDASRGDELGLVANGINDMASGLLQREQIRDAFGRFVNPEVAESFIQNFSDPDKDISMGGQRRQVAILMADIRNFTPLSEGLEPEELTKLLNDYFSEMVAAIQNHGGMVDKFIGDAIMAIFGLSKERENFALDAVLAAQEMRIRLGKFNQRQPAASKPLENGIGIHIGDVVAGYIGSQDRLEFTVIGHAVNVASRIEGITKAPNPPLLFSDTVAELITNDIAIKAVLETPLKGVRDKIQLYTLESIQQPALDM